MATKIDNNGLSRRQVLGTAAAAGGRQAPREASDWHRSSRPRQRRKPDRRSPRRVDRRQSPRTSTRSSPESSTNITCSSQAARPAKSASSDCHRCAS